MEKWFYLSLIVLAPLTASYSNVYSGDSNYMDSHIINSNISNLISNKSDLSLFKNIQPKSLKDTSPQLKVFFDSGCDGSEPGMNPGDTGCVTFIYNGVSVTYITVRGADGNIWLQQSLGSDQVATSSTDVAAYGDLFQWGRWDDGHQLRNSETSANLLSPNNPVGLNGGSPYFYLTSPTWWNGAGTASTWEASSPQDVTSTNGCDPCKALGAGWALPTSDEWQLLVDQEGITNIQTAFDSNLKLTISGTRSSSGVYYDSVRGYYWSKSPSSTNVNFAKQLYYSNFIVNTNAGGVRDQGASIRCMKVPQTPVNVSSVTIQVANNAQAVIDTANGTLQLNALVNPSNANQNVTWSITTGANVASINATGLVTAISNGSVVVRATSVEDTTKFSELNIPVSNQQAAYCVPQFFFPASEAEIAINKITLAGESITWNVDPIEYSSTGYADYTQMEAADLIPGNTYTINIHTNWTLPNFINVRAWIDFNQNFQFDNNEQLENNSNGIDSNGDGSFTFTVPANAAPGKYRLRTMLQYPNTQPENLNSCGTINSYGIAVDYNLEVLAQTTPTDNYCAVTVEYDVEPITSVKFANLSNATSNVINATPSYENFTAMVANVTRGNEYTLTVKGNTNGNFEHDIRVFIDWNQDFTFDMATEYFTASLLPSDGLDDVAVTIPIQIPSTALLGNTRMRIIKDQWNVYEEGEFDACTDAYYGQIEDYTLNIQDATATVKPFDKTSIKIYPNPSTGIFNVATDVLLKRIDVYDVTGQRISTSETKQIDLTQAAPGVYFLNVFAADGAQNTYKVIKK